MQSGILTTLAVGSAAQLVATPGPNKQIRS